MTGAKPTPKPLGRLRRWSVAIGLVLLGALAMLCLWFSGAGFGHADPLFRGSPESEWVKNLKYSDDDQVRVWQGYGEEGVQVLIRGLQHADNPGERAYRQIYRRLPSVIVRFLPAPRPDSTRSSRMCLASLLSNLGEGASNATPIMIQTVNEDEAPSVRQLAINFFTTSEDEHCRLNGLPAPQKRELLPGLLFALRSPGDWGLRNNAANALRWYPEASQEVTPVLIKALRDPEPQVQLLAAAALCRVNPDAAHTSGAAGIVANIARDPDDQVASRAVRALGGFSRDMDMVVPVLLDSLKSTNTLVACEAVWTLEWSPPEFRGYDDSIVPALEQAARRTDNVGGYAGVALKRLKSERSSAPGK